MSILGFAIFWICIGMAQSDLKAAPGGSSDTCPMTCPEEWVRFGYTDSCYKLPSKPAVLDTFDSHQRRCAQMEPTSNIAFINRIRELAFAMAVTAEYGPSWTGNDSSAFLWLGLHSTAKGWEALDGSNIGSNTFVIATNITMDKTPGMCLGVNPRNLGEWKARPCSDKGIAICEMPHRRICRPAAKVLPTIPVDIYDFQSLGLLFNTSVPYLEELFSKVIVDTAITDLSPTSAVDIIKEPNPICQFDCPAGWVSVSKSPTAPCYLLPNASEPDVMLLSLWEPKCQRKHKGAHVAMINGLVELSMWMAIAKTYASQWQKQRPIRYIQLGVMPINGRLVYFDKSDSTGNLLMTLDNPKRLGQALLGDSLVADVTTGGNWQWVPLNQKMVVTMCELPKSLICGEKPRGTVLDLSLEELNVQKLSALFPRMPSVPFLAEVMEGKTQYVFNPFEAEKNEKTQAKYGDGAAYFDCMDAQGKPNRLMIKGAPAATIGQWAQVKCGKGTIDVFKVDLITYVSAWSRCYNSGYDTVMASRPEKNSLDSPFLVGDVIGQSCRWSPNGDCIRVGPMNVTKCF